MSFAPANWKESFSRWLIFQHWIAAVAAALASPARLFRSAGNCDVPPRLAHLNQRTKRLVSLVVLIILVFVVIFSRIAMRLVHLVVPELAIETVFSDQILV
jgi:hypothetical protein